VLYMRCVMMSKTTTNARVVGGYDPLGKTRRTESVNTIHPNLLAPRNQMGQLVGLQSPLSLSRSFLTF
jgi:hypothetical protein